MDEEKLLMKYQEVEKLRNKIKNNKNAMEYYSILKKANTKDTLFGWMFKNDDLLNENLEDLKDYNINYIFAVLSCYENELYSICKRFDFEV